MTVWYVHRRDDGTIAMAGNYPQPGYAEEALDDATNAEIVAFFARAAIPPVPEFARSGDFFHALIDLGWYDAAKAVVDSLAASGTADGKLAKVLWDHASRFERHHPIVLAVAQAIGKTSADLDALFLKTLDYN
jgi:hypothetical protein